MLQKLLQEFSWTLLAIRIPLYDEEVIWFQMLHHFEIVFLQFNANVLVHSPKTSGHEYLTS